MRLTTILLVVTLFKIQANTYSQNTKITLNLKDVTVLEVLKTIESKTEFSFFYNNPDIDLDRKVSIKVRKTTINKILDELLLGTNMLHDEVDRQIVLYPKTPDPVPIEEVPLEIIQRKEIRGTITDVSRTLLPGVNVLVEGTTRGTQTDFDGNYTINANEGEVLVFSYVGMVTQKIVIGKEDIINVIMQEDTAALDEVVVVGFGTQKKENVVGAVETIKPTELRVTSSNLTTALAGRLSGLISYQRSGEPGQDNAEFFVRGVTTFGYKRDPLILIDGVELSVDDFSRLQTDDIASFSILKDATATAIYGARGANGIILVTTKSGVQGKVKISVRSESSFSFPTENIRLADPITYMLLHNEAVKTRNGVGALPYSQRKIAETIAGTNPYVYPATDWQEELFQDFINNQKFNLNMSGGGSAVRYYLAAFFNKDRGLLKVDNKNNFNNNINLNRIGVRTNVNIDLTKTTEAIVRFNGTFDDYQGPIDGGAEIYRKALRTNPVLFPKYYPADEANQHTNHILFGNSTGGNFLNPYADLVKGYKEYSKTLLLAQFELKQDLSMITPGLRARLLINTTRQSSFDVIRQYNPYFYDVSTYDRDTNTYVLNTLNPTTGREYLDYSETSPELFTTFYMENAINYNRTFNEVHDVAGLLVYTRRSSLQNNAGNLQNSLPYRNLGISGRASYAYKNKYSAEFNFGYNGSERFAKNNRFGFFPSAGLAWTISEEPFFKSLTDVVSKLKVRLSYGIVGNDAIGSVEDRFFYLSQVDLNNGGRGYTFGEDFQYSNTGIRINRYANDQITWETATKSNLGIELNLFNDKLKILADVFKEKRDNILMDRSFIPPSLGLESAIRANVGKAKSEGFDFSLDYNQNLGDTWWMSARANFTYARGEFEFFEEPDFADSPWLQHPGQAITQQWGYIAERLFVDENEVANSPEQFGVYGAGDIKYKDINNDGKIDLNDRVPIGHPTAPEIVYGAGISTGYKGFDFSAFFQGSARSSFWIDTNATAPFIGGPGENNALLQVYADSHWSEENQDIYAIWPRLSDSAIENNNQRSTWFMRNGAFLRLKQVEFGYSLPDSLIDKWNISNFRLYVTGTNLFSISKFKLWDTEMGGNGLGYPIQRVFNLGVNVSL